MSRELQALLYVMEMFSEIGSGSRNLGALR